MGSPFATTRELPSGKHQAIWSDGEKRGYKAFSSEAKAKRYAEDQLREAESVIAGTSTKKKSVDEAFESFQHRTGIERQTNEDNGKRLLHFFEEMKIKAIVDITEDVINEYYSNLKDSNKNAGGQHQALKIIRAFCNYCVRRKWLSASPFFSEFKMPTSDFKAWRLTEQEWDRFTSIDPLYEVDIHLNHALRLGRLCMLRRTQVWGMQVKHFKSPDNMWALPTKGLKGRWIKLHPEAVAIILERIQGRLPEQRLFDYWKTPDSLRGSIRKKTDRVGLVRPTENGRMQHARFHDAKGTQISMLVDRGVNIAKLAHISGTTQKTLLLHYIQADVQESFESYQAMDLSNCGATTEQLNQASHNAHESNRVMQGVTRTIVETH